MNDKHNNCLDCESEEEEETLTLQEISSLLIRLTSIVEEIREQVSEESYRSKVKRTNTLIQTLQDLEEKVSDNMNRLNEMLKKLKGVVAVALGNMSQ